ncbi:MAG: NAD(P)-dependent oxidoreductase [Kiritimatiellae bacterium]|nr:NAD(P)-dependent oxidoreductase [Kiritimatiellia bacterium]
MSKKIEGMRVALIGGAGFIGHHLALMLKRHGAEPFVIDSLGVNNFLAFRSTGDKIRNRQLYLRIIQDRLNLLNEADIPLYVQDAREYHALSRLVREIRPNAIVHLSAVAHAGRSNKDPYSTFDHSLRTLENALDASRELVDHFVFFSSSMVYGDFQQASVTEESPCEPLGIYGALKYAGEKIVIAYNQVFDLVYTIVRPSALYGERCVSRRVGQIFIENALEGLEITIQGDGSDRLDFTYVDDVCHGLLRVLTEPKAANQILNLTYGESRSVSDMLGILKKEFPSVQPLYESRDKLTPKRGTLKVDKARDLIGYDPQYPLEKGFVKYIHWYKSIWAGNPSAGQGGCREQS